jgi:hypothetical protein
MSPMQPKLICRTLPEQRTSEEKRKFLFQRLDALAQAFSNAIRTEAAVGRK